MLYVAIIIIIMMMVIIALMNMITVYSCLLFPFSYEPELFPGLIYRMVKPRIVLLIFVSGKVVLTGKKCIP